MKKIILVALSLAILQPFFAMNQEDDLWEYVIDEPGVRRLSPAEQEEADRQLALKKIEQEKEVAMMREYITSYPYKHIHCSVLCEAIIKNKPAFLQLLIDAGVDINSLKPSWLQGDTALIRAATRNLAEVCKLLLHAGADMYAKNNDGNTALYLAAKQQRENACQVLVDYQREVNNTYIALLCFYRMKQEKKPIGVLYHERKHLLLPYLVQGKYVPMAKLLNTRDQARRTLFDLCPIDCLKPEPEGWFANCSIQ